MTNDIQSALYLDRAAQDWHRSLPDFARVAKMSGAIITTTTTGGTK